MQDHKTPCMHIRIAWQITEQLPTNDKFSTQFTKNMCHWHMRIKFKSSRNYRYKINPQYILIHTLITAALIGSAERCHY